MLKLRGIDIYSRSFSIYVKKGNDIDKHFCFRYNNRYNL